MKYKLFYELFEKGTERTHKGHVIFEARNDEHAQKLVPVMCREAAGKAPKGSCGSVQPVRLHRVKVLHTRIAMPSRKRMSGNPQVGDPTIQKALRYFQGKPAKHSPILRIS